MTTIAALTSLRNIALDRADACETVLAMNLHFGVAREIGRIINELRHGCIDIPSRRRARSRGLSDEQRRAAPSHSDHTS
ncbi:hypothetical protein [Bosea sp. 685]|uniref:hypothetical protein n=1 Tax=Bosea sp. 685 TaxID=3080057 RepID=UPI002892B0DD|nr:hypothetical protein [Bosea sp. 685]WNJ87945.1 hypothetical protein RMR04_00915 [Bosea sp. 685]